MSSLEDAERTLTNALLRLDEAISGAEAATSVETQEVRLLSSALEQGAEQVALTSYLIDQQNALLERRAEEVRLLEAERERLRAEIAALERRYEELGRRSHEALVAADEAVRRQAERVAGAEVPAVAAPSGGPATIARVDASAPNLDALDGATEDGRLLAAYAQTYYSSAMRALPEVQRFLSLPPAGASTGDLVAAFRAMAVYLDAELSKLERVVRQDIAPYIGLDGFLAEALEAYRAQTVGTAETQRLARTESFERLVARLAGQVGERAAPSAVQQRIARFGATVLLREVAVVLALQNVTADLARSPQGRALAASGADPSGLARTTFADLAAAHPAMAGYFEPSPGAPPVAIPSGERRITDREKGAT